VKRYFDTDQHLTLPRGFYDGHWPAKYKHVLPCVVDLPDGTQGWSYENGKIMGSFGLDNAGGENPAKLKNKFAYAELDPSFYDAKERIKAMDRDGVQATLLFSSGGGAAAATDNDELYEVTFRAYNDAAFAWAQEGDGKRILPAAQIPCRSLQMSMDELRRVAELGYKHILCVMSPTNAGRPVPEDDPFWSLVEDTGLVVSMHGGGVPGGGSKANTTRVPDDPAFSLRLQENIAAIRGAALGVQQTLSLFTLSGLLERHPRLKIALVETSAGWLPSYLEQLDALYLRNRPLMDPGKQLKQLPSEYLSTIKISIDREVDAIRHRDRIGLDRIMIGSDFPHIGNYWPHTRYYLDLLFRDVPESEVQAMVWDNGASLYGVEYAT
jgi:predicted TIM-barrel fold metal-dependent hydrolase